MIYSVNEDSSLKILTNDAAVWAGSIGVQHAVCHQFDRTDSWLMCHAEDSNWSTCLFLLSQSGGSQLEQMEHKCGQNQWGTRLGLLTGVYRRGPAALEKERCRFEDADAHFPFYEKGIAGVFPHWLYKCCFFHREELERLFKRGYQALADTSVHRNVSSEQHTGVKRQLSFTQPAQRDRPALRHSYLGTVAVFTMHQLSKQFNCQLFVVAAWLTDTLVSAWFEISHLRGNMLSKTMIDTSNIWLFEYQID